MKKWLLLLMLLSPSVGRAELVTPYFTQGSMQSTTTMTQEIAETVETTTYGSAINKWTGENVTHTSASGGGIVDTDSVFTLHTAGDPFTLEITTRAASQVLSVEDVTRAIDTTSTSTSLSVFSQ